MAEKSEGKKQGQGSDKNRKIEACPHCGQELSPWQQVLLTIDRALVCKNCWYRIILDSSEEEGVAPAPEKKE